MSSSLSSNYPALYEDLSALRAEQSVSYPSMENQTPVAVASAPIDHRLVQLMNRHSMTCASCLVIFSGTTQPSASLSCGHKMHQDCFMPIYMQTPQAQKHNMGGVKICKHCVEHTLFTGGTNASTNPETKLDECLKKVKQKHREAYPDVDSDSILQRGALQSDTRIMLGEEGVGHYISTSLIALPKIASSAASSLMQTARSFRRTADADGSGSVDGFVVDDAMLQRMDAEALERKRFELRGKELVDELLRKGRTFDRIIDTMRITVVDLFNAGIDSMTLLERLGFDLKKHSNHLYRKVIPIYFLVEKYGLSFDTHFAPMARSKGQRRHGDDDLSLFEVLIRMQPSKEEALLLGITVQKLVSLGIKKEQLKALNIVPSSMIAFMGLEWAHLVHLGFTNDDFIKDAKWNKNIKSNEQANELYKKFIGASKSK